MCKQTVFKSGYIKKIHSTQDVQENSTRIGLWSDRMLPSGCTKKSDL